MVVNAVGAWTEETLSAIPNTAKHLADVLAGTDVRLIGVGRAHHKCPIREKRTTVAQFYPFSCPFLVNRTITVWFYVLVV